ncbi:MAG: hypothetical protein ACRDYW_02100 [Acidimicrobiales bacterium]
MVVRLGFDVWLGLVLVLGAVVWLGLVVVLGAVVRIALVVVLGFLAGLGLVLGGDSSRGRAGLRGSRTGTLGCGRDGRWWCDGGLPRGQQIGIRPRLELDGWDRSRLPTLDGLRDGSADADRSQPGYEDEEKSTKCRRPVHGANPPRSSTPAG